MSQRRQFYPELQPYQTGMLPVSDGHSIYFEESGNPEGKPAIYIHGGPGGGSNSQQRRVFDPKKYRIILFDQRGCGRSKPFASLEANTTWHLVADMEALRQQLNIEKWLVCGGSWGSTLSLAYAQTHPEKVTELVLRGLFTLRKSELDWYYNGGAAHLFPDEWEKFVAPIPADEQHDMINACYKRLTGNDEDAKIAVAKAWSIWEGSTISLLRRPAQVANFGNEKFATAFARIESHYFVHGGFFENDDWLISNLESIRHIPCILIQGRYDACTPMTTAWDIHKKWPEASLKIVDDAGHAFNEPGIAHEIVCATDLFSDT